jgi:hypothetical protein
MKLQILIIFCILIVGCKKDEIRPKRTIENFELNYQGKEAILYNNSECEFDNRNNQSQFTYTYVPSPNLPKAYVLFSTYKNINEADSTINQFWFNLFVEYSNGVKSFSSDYLKSLLESEDSDENTNHLYPNILVEVCGKRFDNEDRETEPGESFYKIHDNFKYKINDFEVLYKSDCVDRELLFLDITVEGMLYQQSLTGENDSLYLNKSNMKLLFDIE